MGLFDKFSKTFDKNGYDLDGYDKDGYDKKRYNKNGFDKDCLLYTSDAADE